MQAGPALESLCHFIASSTSDAAFSGDGLSTVAREDFDILGREVATIRSETAQADTGHRERIARTERQQGFTTTYS